MKLKPLHDYLLIRRHDAESKSPGGIYIPENAKQDSTEGEVLATGQGRMLDDGTLRIFGPDDPHPGDRVVFGKYAGVEVQSDDAKYILVRWSDIIGVYRK